eukprot:GHRQ01025025.1.p2 GENE.GHRQ01025025.1~~GHRQ01025025.1.p2  ORF type:complete len:176 (-),score=1.67 GHRQ01025025.1:395-922(-)
MAGSVLLTVRQSPETMASMQQQLAALHKFAVHLPATACTTNSVSLLDASSSSSAGISPVNCSFLKRLPITVFFSSRTACSLADVSEAVRPSSNCWQDLPVPFLATMAMCCCSRNRLPLLISACSCAASNRHRNVQITLFKTGRHGDRQDAGVHCKHPSPHITLVHFVVVMDDRLL